MSTGRGIVFLLTIFLLLLTSTLGAAVFLGEKDTITAPPVVVPRITEAVVPNSEPPPIVLATSSVWFLGDVMLSRQVGERLLLRGDDFPWTLVRDRFSGSAVVVNFESCLSTEKTFSYTEPFRFPVRAEVVNVLRGSGVTHVSLANNHALDCGQGDLDTARRLFIDGGITPFGHPVSFSDASIAYVFLGETRVAVIGLHTLFSEPSDEALGAIVKTVKEESDLLVMFVHWGEEYDLRASAAQQRLATTLAGLGVDIVIGHHPHVVQPIERIGDTIVVYSLGNFIFDQYFSEAVQTGLTVRLETGPGLGLSLYPVTSVGSQNQPYFMSATSSTALLEELAQRSDQGLREQIKAGFIDLSFLASSSKSAIITQ